jgi:hypothetical protein
MNEQIWAERFAQDVDHLFAVTESRDSEPQPVEYQQMLGLARALATRDLSGESRVRVALRRRLLTQTGIWKEQNLKNGFLTRVLSWQKQSAVTLGTLVLIALLASIWILPGAQTIAAQGLEFVQTMILGQNTAMHRVNPSQAAPTNRAAPAKPSIEQKGDLWIVRTAIGNFAADIPPGRKFVEHRLSTIADAQIIAPFPIRQPGFLPTGYTLREAIVAPDGSTFIFYDGPHGDILLTQMAGARSSDSSMIGMLTDQPIRSVTLNGRAAGWVEGYGLMWEADGVSYILGGTKLSLAQAIRVAESLK